MDNDYFTEIRQTLESFEVQIEKMEALLYMAQDELRTEQFMRERDIRELEYWKERAKRLPNVES